MGKHVARAGARCDHAARFIWHAGAVSARRPVGRGCAVCVGDSSGHRCGCGAGEGDKAGQSRGIGHDVFECGERGFRLAVKRDGPRIDRQTGLSGYLGRSDLGRGVERGRHSRRGVLECADQGLDVSTCLHADPRRHSCRYEGAALSVGGDVRRLGELGRDSLRAGTIAMGHLGLLACRGQDADMA